MMARKHIYEPQKHETNADDTNGERPRAKSYGYAYRCRRYQKPEDVRSVAKRSGFVPHQNPVCGPLRKQLNTPGKLPPLNSIIAQMMFATHIAYRRPEAPVRKPDKHQPI